MREITVSSADAGQPLIRFLGRVLPNTTNGFLYKMLRKKNIVLNDKKAAGKETLKSGDTIKIYFSEETYIKFSGETDAAFSIPTDDYELLVLYEDDDIIAVSKPAGVLSQKDSADELSINEYILSYLIKSGAYAPDLNMTFKPSVANRLDRNTSGIILAGKTYIGQEMLSRQLHDKDVTKYYYCLCEGRVEHDMELCGYIKKDEATNTSVVTEDEVPGSKYVETHFNVIGCSDSVSLLRVQLLTGRSHQIRAHLLSIGHPIVGDPKYADAKRNAYFKKKYDVRHQLLHAHEIILKDGTDIVSPLPKKFLEVAKGEGIQGGKYADLEFQGA